MNMTITSARTPEVAVIGTENASFPLWEAESRMPSGGPAFTMIDGVLVYGDSRVPIKLFANEPTARAMSGIDVRGPDPDSPELVVKVGDNFHTVTAVELVTDKGNIPYARRHRGGVTRLSGMGTALIWYAPTEDHGTCRFSLESPALSGRSTFGQGEVVLRQTSWDAQGNEHEVARGILGAGDKTYTLPDELRTLSIVQGVMARSARHISRRGVRSGESVHHTARVVSRHAGRAALGGARQSHGTNATVHNLTKNQPKQYTAGLHKAA